MGDEFLGFGGVFDPGEGCFGIVEAVYECFSDGLVFLGGHEYLDNVGGGGDGELDVGEAYAPLCPVVVVFEGLGHPLGGEVFVCVFEDSSEVDGGGHCGSVCAASGDGIVEDDGVADSEGGGSGGECGEGCFYGRGECASEECVGVGGGDVFVAVCFPGEEGLEEGFCFVDVFFEGGAGFPVVHGAPMTASKSMMSHSPVVVSARKQRYSPMPGMTESPPVASSSRGTMPFTKRRRRSRWGASKGEREGSRWKSFPRSPFPTATMRRSLSST